jgi:hypothetical protein
MLKTLTIGLLVITLVAGLVIGGFIWQSAKDEVIILCGNFKPGVTEASVRRQLDTGNFLRYKLEVVDSGGRIDVDSLYNFTLYHCTIDLDQNGKVTAASTN